MALIYNHDTAIFVYKHSNLKNAARILFLITTMEIPETNEKLLQFPIARVKRIMKADPDLNYIHHEAVFLIAKATELLLESLAKESYTFTASDGKKTVSKKHVESAVNNIDALAFLDGMLD